MEALQEEQRLFPFTQDKEKEHGCKLEIIFQVLLFGCLALIFQIWLYFKFFDPNKPTFNVESIALQNINMSANYATGDWSFTLSMKKPQTSFGWSYEGFNASLLYSQTDRTLSKTTVPAFSQVGQNQTSFTLHFQGVTLPVNYRVFTSNIFGSGVNLEFSEVFLWLDMEGRISAVPDTSLRRLARWTLRSINVRCGEFKVGFSSDSAGAALVYYGKRHYSCYS